MALSKGLAVGVMSLNDILQRDQQSRREHQLKLMQVELDRKNQASQLGLDADADWDTIATKKAELARQQQDYRSLQIAEYEKAIAQELEKEKVWETLADQITGQGLTGYNIMSFLEERGLADEYDVLKKRGGDISHLLEPVEPLMKGDWTPESRVAYYDALSDPDTTVEEARKLLVPDPSRGREATVYDKEQRKLARAKEFLNMYARESGKSPVGIGRMGLEEWIQQNPDIIANSDFEQAELSDVLATLQTESLIRSEYQELRDLDKNLRIEAKEEQKIVDTLSGQLREGFSKQFAGRSIPEFQAIRYINTVLEQQAPGYSHLSDAVFQQLKEGEDITFITQGAINAKRKPRRERYTQDLGTFRNMDLPGDLDDVVDELQDSIEESGDYRAEDNSILHSKLQQDLENELFDAVYDLDTYDKLEGKLKEKLQGRKDNVIKFLENAFFYVSGENFPVQFMNIPETEDAQLMGEFLDKLSKSDSVEDRNYAELLLATMRHRWSITDVEINFKDSVVEGYSNQLTGEQLEYGL